MQGVGDIEDQRKVIAGSLHHAEPQHVHHEVVVTEVGASLAQQQLLVSAFAEFVHDVAHLFRTEELRFLDVDHSPCFRHGANQIGLPRQEGRELDDVGDLGGSDGFLRTVHIRDHRNAVGVLHRLEDFQPFVEAGATEGMNGGAVGFVVRRLEHQWDVQPSADVFVVAGATQGKVEIFENVHAAQQGEGAIVRESDVAQLDLMRHGFKHFQ